MGRHTGECLSQHPFPIHSFHPKLQRRDKVTPKHLQMGLLHPYPHPHPHEDVPTPILILVLIPILIPIPTSLSPSPSWG